MLRMFSFSYGKPFKSFHIFRNSLLKSYRKSSKVQRVALWILGGYATSAKDIIDVIAIVNQTLDEVPIIEAEQRRLALRMKAMKIRHRMPALSRTRSHRMEHVRNAERLQCCSCL
ncbi:AAEL005574-PA [Aedes aegypti]|uniref:AAEL005574-PA n=1 Tax=Aedes aegypti TaxID=7159 RepID=Q179N9_AEDAE|nr:AAEL005574-PA [Aedes aegypti]